MNQSNKSKRGFASMEPDKVKRIASLGGKSHSVEYMREIARRGGIASGRKRKSKKDFNAQKASK
jgi:general stress protein YciG